MNVTALKPSSETVAIIPARYGSTRLPGKPLLPIGRKPMVLWVVERALACRNVSRAIVATDDRRIYDVVRGAGFEAVMTRIDHATGSDRLAEVVAGLNDVEVIVNVQGDEPLISSRTIEKAVDAMHSDDDTAMVTTCEQISRASDVLSSDVVKVVINDRGNALYFSRSPVPFPHDAVRRYGTIATALEKEPDILVTFRKHTGLYVFRRSLLLEYATWHQGKLEIAERLEQIRVLERGLSIKVIESCSPSIGVDTEEDFYRVNAIVEGDGFRGIH